jgi:hypothetical protein
MKNLSPTGNQWWIAKKTGTIKYSFESVSRNFTITKEYGLKHGYDEVVLIEINEVDG